VLARESELKVDGVWTRTIDALSLRTGAKNKCEVMLEIQILDMHTRLWARRTMPLSR
jgi:hypothetical protein